MLSSFWIGHIFATRNDSQVGNNKPCKQYNICSLCRALRTKPPVACSARRGLLLSVTLIYGIAIGVPQLCDVYEHAFNS